MPLLSIVGLLVLLVLLILFFYYVPFLLWLNAKVSGVNISLVQLFLMRIRKVPPSVIVNAMIEAHKAGLNQIRRDDLEAHYLAGGHVAKGFMTYSHENMILIAPPLIITEQQLLEELAKLDEVLENVDSEYIS